MKVPFVDLDAQYLAIKPEIDAAVSRVVAGGRFVLGPDVAAFEKEFSRFVRTKYSVAVASGTAALQLALVALDTRTGDEVITTPHTCIATVEAIVHAGARPVLVDVDEYQTIDPTSVADKINKRTKAVLVVHMYGQTPDMQELGKLAAGNNIALIEDAAHACGARYQEQAAGSFGRFGCFSFYPSKNLGAMGEAGAVTMNSEADFELIRSLRNHGESEKYYHETAGFNFRMDTIQGAVLGVKLKYLTEWNRKRRQLAGLYTKKLTAAGIDGVPEVRPGCEHVWHIYALFCGDRNRRDGLRDYLAGVGIETNMHYPVPVHRQKAFGFLGHGAGDFPNTERYAEGNLSLPLYPELTAEMVDYVCEHIVRYLGR